MTTLDEAPSAPAPRWQGRDRNERWHRTEKQAAAYARSVAKGRRRRRRRQVLDTIVRQVVRVGWATVVGIATGVALYALATAGLTRLAEQPTANPTTATTAPAPPPLPG